MCRIVGFRDFNLIGYNKKTIIKQMTDVLAYGGPDSDGFYSDNHIELGHRRLSIIDLSPAGHQPMEWDKYVIVFNGEIYNYANVRAELISKGVKFNSGSDTEVLLKGFDFWGKSVVDRIKGMFAFAIWNKETLELTLCRDRFGVKPLYYYWKDGLFMFASELKSFHEHPNFDKEINQNAVSLFLSQGYINAPHSIFRHVKKLKQGSFFTLDKNGSFSETTYYNILDNYQNTELNTKSESEILQDVEKLMKESFNLRMVSDVPVGIFLSGGVDSSLVTAMLQSDNEQPLHTYTIGFKEKEYNEAEIAQSVAKHLGTHHSTIYCTENDIFEYLETYSDMYDEPFGAESSIPTHILSKYARKTVKVCLSADAGDELFGGYSKYKFAMSFQRVYRHIPIGVRKCLSMQLRNIDSNNFDKLVSNKPYFNKFKDINTKFRKFSNSFSATNLEDFMAKSSRFIDDSKLSSLSNNPYPLFATNTLPKENQLMGFMCAYDFNTFIEGHVLAKVDRATMHTALEGREPFLDQHLVDYCLGIPDSIKYKDNTSKYLLKKLLQKYIPKEVIERPKQGFTIPVEKWLKFHSKNELLDISKDTEFCKLFGLHQNDLTLKISDFNDTTNNKYDISPHFYWYLLILYKWYKRWMR